MAVDRTIVSLHILNILDGIFTLVAVSMGVEEANPAMRSLLALDPFLFICVKYLTVTLAIIYLNKQVKKRRHRQVLFGTLLFIYSLVICWHVTGFVLLLSNS
jgi:hypothetical protein